MPSNDLPQGIYAPLSQAMTDSDSEEEIHNSNKPGGGKNYHKRLAPQYFFNFENLNNHYNNYNCRNFYSKSSARNNKMAMNGGAAVDGGSLASFNSESDLQNTSADNVAILGPSARKNSNSNDEGMSPLRKLCFIGSILFCFFTVAVFLWVVPCNDGGVCPAPLDRIKTHNWLNNYTSIELKGKINVVDGKEGRTWEKYLLFLYRGDVFYPEFAQNNKMKNGIISIVGSSGAVAWLDYHNNEPLSMDCSLIDIDRNGKSDCLIVDEVGEIGVIHPISGQWWWKYKPPTQEKIDTLDLPVILPDMNDDKVFEILLATSKSANDTGRRNFIRILSGKTGRPIGDGHLIHDCIKIRKLQIDGGMVNYLCVQNKTDVKRSKTILEFYSLVTNKSIGQKSIGKSGNIPQFKNYGQRKEVEHQGNVYNLNGRELYIENNGKCPHNCNMSFLLSEKKDGKVVTIKNFTQSGMYGMVPTQWHFKNGKSDLSGFVIKFWKWDDTDLNETVTRAKRETSSSYEFNVFDQLIQKRHTYSIPPRKRVERSIANITKQKSGTNNYKMQLIKETVYIIIFNGGHTDFENTSQSNIIQFCRNNSDSEVICQPDLNNQENSLLIADLDQDGSQELVSYYSTFVNQNEEKKDWKLVTYVNLLRLEAELPSLYENGVVGGAIGSTDNTNIAANANV